MLFLKKKYPNKVILIKKSLCSRGTRALRAHNVNDIAGPRREIVGIRGTFLFQKSLQYYKKLSHNFPQKRIHLNFKIDFQSKSNR